ncbi:MAG: polyprenyl synthetase family protein [Methyloceanibacter sp.]|jgi:farnesyl diphosphate synthase|nr:polyprenyl synthetase family protein [Methyloceanibacter sp.]
MTFADELERIARLTERKLDGLIPASSTRLGEALRYALLGPGKRLRPFLLVSSARIFGAPEDRALEAATALECIHCYSLVHDDLPCMDDDDLRRGRPTTHIAFDEATAVLTGDGLLTLAFEIMSGPQIDPDPAIRVELVSLLAKAAGWQGMVLGQALDLEAEGRSLNMDETLQMQALKTGALFKFACEAGAVLGRATPDARRALLDYATALGQAFQLADDLLDAQGTTAKLGKAAAKDAARGKATFIALLGIDGAKAKLAGLVRDAESALAPLGPKAEPLAEAARFVASREN